MPAPDRSLRRGPITRIRHIAVTAQRPRPFSHPHSIPRRHRFVTPNEEQTALRIQGCGRRDSRAHSGRRFASVSHTSSGEASGEASAPPTDGPRLCLGTLPLPGGRPRTFHSSGNNSGSWGRAKNAWLGGSSGAVSTASANVSAPAARWALLPSAPPLGTLTCPYRGGKELGRKSGNVQAERSAHRSPQG